MPRHTIDTCYKKNGYPDGSRPRRSVSHAHNVVSDDCDDSLEETKSVTAVPSATSNGSSINLTQEQYDQLLALLHSTTSLSKPHDTPSSSHPPHITNHIMTDPSQSYTLAATDGYTILEDDWYS
ncbi:hypothetical protein V6Z11_D02G151700 [Gossypium hirsutum]